MITFSKLGNYGRLGNQLFQYAYLRSMAVRLNTKFWCPAWDGDHIFCLADQEIREKSMPATLGPLYDQAPHAGFSESALDLEDGFDVQGYFQSDRYYLNRSSVCSWYSFSSCVIESASSKFDLELLADSVSISLRLNSDYESTREYFPLYPKDYYLDALRLFPGVKNVVVFSDRPDLAKIYLSDLGVCMNFCHIEGASPAEQLWLMTQCGRGNIMTNSTFSWWGGYLNINPGAKIVAPREWVRPGVSVPIVDILPSYWVTLKALHPIWDNFHVWRLTHPRQTLRRVLARVKAFRRNH